VIMELISVLCSIREFCEIDMPIWLFDKDGGFQVVRLEQVCNGKLFDSEALLTRRFVASSAVVWSGTSPSSCMRPY